MHFTPIDKPQAAFAVQNSVNSDSSVSSHHTLKTSFAVWVESARNQWHSATQNGRTRLLPTPLIAHISHSVQSHGRRPASNCIQMCCAGVRS